MESRQSASRENSPLQAMLQMTIVPRRVPIAIRFVGPTSHAQTLTKAYTFARSCRPLLCFQLLSGTNCVRSRVFHVTSSSHGVYTVRVLAFSGYGGLTLAGSTIKIDGNNGQDCVRVLRVLSGTVVFRHREAQPTAWDVFSYSLFLCFPFYFPSFQRRIFAFLFLCRHVRFFVIRPLFIYFHIFSRQLLPFFSLPNHFSCCSPWACARACVCSSLFHFRRGENN